MIEILQGLTSLKACIDMLKTANASRDDRMIQSATDELIQRHSDLTLSFAKLTAENSQLILANTALEKEMATLRVKLDEKANYALYEIEPGRFCYRYEPANGSVTPNHYLCQPCYEKGLRSILRDHRSSGGMGLECVENKAHFVWSAGTQK